MKEIMKFDYRKLRGKIIEKYGSFLNFSDAVGISNTTISLCINNKQTWNQQNIIKVSEKLEIPQEEIPVYFFTLEVQ